MLVSACTSISGVKGRSSLSCEKLYSNFRMRFVTSARLNEHLQRARLMLRDPAHVSRPSHNGDGAVGYFHSFPLSRKYCWEGAERDLGTRLWVSPPTTSVTPRCFAPGVGGSYARRTLFIIPLSCVGALRVWLTTLVTPRRTTGARRSGPASPSHVPGDSPRSFWERALSDLSFRKNCF